MILPTEILKGMVDDVISIKQSNTISIKMMIRNHQDPKFDIDDASIDIMEYEQNFMSNTTDNINISVNMTPQQVQKLVNFQSDLFADIIFEYVDTTTGEVVLEEKPIRKQYKVLVHDLSSIAKKYGITAFEAPEGSDTISGTPSSTFIKVEMQLITDNEYKINRASFVGMMKDVTVDDAIKYMASVMGIKSIKMVPSDNPTKYQHLSIPPDKGGFRAAFDYLQNTYGVYTNGFRHYITNGVLYVYPHFDMKAERSPKLHVIRVSENSYGGSQNYHRVEDSKDLTIVSNSKLHSQTLSNIGSENEGNAKLFSRSDGVIDGQVKSSDMSLNNITASMSGKADSTIVKGSAVAKYVKPTMNLLNHASIFSESNTEMMVFGWSNARIEMIYPGMPTVFIFDEKKAVMSKTGVVESAKYSITRSSKKVFICNAVLTVRSDPKAVPYSA